MTQHISLTPDVLTKSRWIRFTKRAVKRIVAVALAVYFAPAIFATYVGLGLLDFCRNSRRTFAALDRYFAGNGFFTWLLSPFNLLMDLIALPYRNKGIYQLSDLPKPYQDEINAVTEAALRSDLIARLEAKLGDRKRGMIFFKWYGQNMQTSVDVPEFHREYKYVRTIGVSIFNTKQSTGKHFGPLRVTLRVLYNINRIESRDVYIRVGNHIHYWHEKQLFIFDDTLQHQSCNQSEEVRYCMFVDVLRPSLFPSLMRNIVACAGISITCVKSSFYQHWEFIK